VLSLPVHTQLPADDPSPGNQCTPARCVKYVAFVSSISCRSFQELGSSLRVDQKLAVI
jgi:hypothetical protein